MKLTPVLKDYLWGGTKLRDSYGKKTEQAIVAESWELSCHPDGPSRIANGAYAGRTLQDYVAEHPEAIGEAGKAFEGFPLLIKLIDAKESLSVQVHPDDAYAREHEGERGKTEMWYVIEAEPGAKLIYGFRTELTKEEFRAHIEGDTLLDVVHEVPVKKGDVFFIEAGTLHSIGGGILLAEVQQSSNSTYRVYDFGRVGADGKPRELHIEKALDVTRRERPKHGTKPLARIPIADMELVLLVSCNSFAVYHASVREKAVFRVDAESFQSLTLMDGRLTLETHTGGERLELRKGDTVFLPANMGTYSLTGSGEVLLGMLP